MNPVATMDGAKLAVGNLDGVLAFLASRSKESTRALPENAGEVFRGMLDEVNRLLRSVIETKTAAEYDAAYDAAFPKYVALTLAMSQFANAVVPSDVVQRLTRESICELEADFREKGLAAFGSAVRDQAMFTVWTLRKILDLVRQITAAKLDPTKRKQDEQCSMEFNFHALRAQFGLDSLNFALESNIAVYPDILASLTDDLRSMVDAYTWARRGVEHRLPAVNATASVSQMDDEDTAWLEASAHEMGPMLEESEGL